MGFSDLWNKIGHIRRAYGRKNNSLETIHFSDHNF